MNSLFTDKLAFLVHECVLFWSSVLNLSLRFILTSNWHIEITTNSINNLLKYGMELLSDMQKAVFFFRGVFLERSFCVDFLSSVCS